MAEPVFIVIGQSTGGISLFKLETPYADPHVRCCERCDAKTSAYSIFSKDQPLYTASVREPARRLRNAILPCPLQKRSGRFPQPAESPERPEGSACTSKENGMDYALIIVTQMRQNLPESRDSAPGRHSGSRRNERFRKIGYEQALLWCMTYTCGGKSSV